MPRTLSVTSAAAAMLAILAGTVFLAHDGETVVPPPEAVGEQLLRQLHAHREVRTAQLLTNSLKAEWPPQRLRDWWQPLERRVGGIRQITGERNAIDDSGADAWIRVEGRTRSILLQMRMQREHGLWAVAQFPPRNE